VKTPKLEWKTPKLTKINLNEKEGASKLLSIQTCGHPNFSANNIAIIDEVLGKYNESMTE